VCERERGRTVEADLWGNLGWNANTTLQQQQQQQQNDELHGSRRNRRWGFRGVLPGNRHQTSSHWARQLNSAVSLTEIKSNPTEFSQSPKCRRLTFLIAS